MKIDSYSIGMESERLYKSYSSTFKYVRGDGSNSSTGSQLSSFGSMLENEATGQEELKENGQNQANDTNDVARRAMQDLSRKSPVNAAVAKTQENAIDSFRKLRQYILNHILDMLFGKKMDCKELNEVSTSDFIPYDAYVQREYTETCFYEQESVSFDAKGIVKTADGREIDIDINVSMSREFSAYYTEITNTELVVYCDPLVINYSGDPASLSDTKFFFDLDSDGVEDEISRLSSGSGYLALDKNGDGTINDGSELFGTKSGDGFKDLAAYDSDGNGWIDENDDIFDKLKIWVTDSDGNNTLYTLKEKDVGAIYLGNVDTNYSLNSKLDNTVNGAIRKTGLFLYESGMTGTIQHVDLVS